MALGVVAALGQASALPGAAVSGVDVKSGRELMSAMVKALGGEAWVGRKTWVVKGRVAKFYKGQADAGSTGFEEYGRVKPFGVRFVVVSHYGALVAKDHRDVEQVWTAEGGGELTYKGARALGAKEVEDFERARAHSLDVVVGEWLGEAGVEVRYEGTMLVESERVDVVDVERENGDSVSVRMDARTHLPVSVSWRYRDVEFGDWDTDAVAFADYHAVQGVMTAYSVTAVHNGDTTSEWFVTSVAYGAVVGDEVFEARGGLGK
jgi:hypothetical protein